MLHLDNIKKDYKMSDETVNALRGVSVNFRRSEFVAILGPSGCGKTTLLNIIGGLDRYTSGDLIIEGKSTKDFKDRDWDTYRNHSVGFVFQSYNLIQHISILANVELALTISGVGAKERKKRALEALETVGLGNKAKKMPNQLSGGQMQRVAIARALVNNPEIVLADEPTGALDSETSVQIMELLKQVSKQRLVIMVTHNPELAKQYATRIINMKDGCLTHDSMPYEGESVSDREKTHQSQQVNKGNKKNTSMSFLTALGLSFNNLMTKKARTMLISFAGSIGIIGITLILSLSFGFNNYIRDIQTNSMSTYPLSVQRVSSPDLMSIMAGGGSHSGSEKYPDDDIVGENSMITDLLTQMTNYSNNDTASFKKYLELPENQEILKDITNGVQYGYSQELNVFALSQPNGENLTEPIRLNPVNDEHKDSYVFKANQYKTKSGDPLSEAEQKVYQTVFESLSNEIATSLEAFGGSPFGPLLDNQPLLEEQFDVLKGHLPTNINEVVIRVSQYNEITDLFLYGMGVKDMSYMMSQLGYATINSSLPALGMHKPADDPKYEGSFDELMNLEFSLILNSQTYQKVIDESTLGYHYESIYENEELMLEKINNSFKLKVVGIIRPKQGVTATSYNGAIGYHPDLYKYLVEQSINPTESCFQDSTVLIDQLNNPTFNIFTGELFSEGNDDLKNPEYVSNLEDLGYVDYDTPDYIYIYPKSFEDKNKVLALIDQYNESVTYSHRINVNDSVGAMLDSVQVIVDSVSYVLIAFVSISLLVSSIMIGIITYVSVLERTKEIGVLRSIGARKKDISRVFNAETLIIGLVAGLLGIGIAAILNIPIMLIINSLTEIGLVIAVPWYGAVLLPVISVCLTIVAGLIPSSIAAKRDPVIALRTE